MSQMSPLGKSHMFDSGINCVFQTAPWLHQTCANVLMALPEQDAVTPESHVTN